ncbi:MAG: hypothetical protein M3P50_05130 [Actinomycetota bacterium]|nr:hypothetical protein [Actinomycetota bacterium]
MSRRRWPLVVAGALGALLLVGAGWLLGRSSADTSVPTAAAPVREVGGVPVGVERSRPGALAALDNYTVVAAEAIFKDPGRYEVLVRTVFAPEGQARELADAARLQQRSAELIGTPRVAVVGARRLESYDGVRARATSWLGVIAWPAFERSSHGWQLLETALRWDGEKWLVEIMQPSPRTAPAPWIVKRESRAAFQHTTFSQELRGMTVPAYGVLGR